MKYMGGDCSNPLVCESDLKHLQGHLHVYYLNIIKLFIMEKYQSETFV